MPSDSKELGQPEASTDGGTKQDETIRLEAYHVAKERASSRFEVGYLRLLLDASHENLSEAARIAGIDRTTLYRLLERRGFRRTLSSRWAPPEQQVAA